MLLGLASAVPSGPADAVRPGDEPSAVIVDQLSLTSPNASFVREATRLLEESGYRVDHFSGREVTVDLYRRLPSLGHDLVILRTHSTAQHANGLLDDVVLFTNEEYRPLDHLWDQYRVHVSRVAYTTPQTDRGGGYFGIWPEFFHDAESGFDGSLVVMMGCQGLVNPSLAGTLLERGASTYVGWDEWVTADRTDTATLAFLQGHLTGSPVEEAVRSANDRVGEDPLHGSRLGATGGAGGLPA